MISNDRQINELLNDFISGKISCSGAKELLEIINHQDVDDKIIAWLYKIWDESTQRSTTFHQERVYEKIRRKLNLHTKIHKKNRICKIHAVKGSHFICYIIEYLTEDHMAK